MTNPCVQCRNRKVKCDGSPIRCRNCERLDLTCSFSNLGIPDTSHEQGIDSLGEKSRDLTSYTYAGTQRKRVQRACTACQSQKQRCSAEKPTCKRCLSRGFICQYLPSKRKVVPAGISPQSESSQPYSTGLQPERQSSPDSSISNVSMLNSNDTTGAELNRSEHLRISLNEKTLLKRHIEAFFDYVYPIPSYSFLHKALFLEEFNEGKCAIPLLQAVCGAGSIFLSTDRHERRRGVAWISEAEGFVLRNIDDPSLTNIQTLLIVSFHYTASRNLRKIMTLLSIASRMAYLSRLNYESGNVPFVVQETRRRLMWAIYTLDRFYSGGLPDFTVCPAESVHLTLPCNEMNFELEISTTTEPLQPVFPSVGNSGIGVFGFYIRMLDIRNRILWYTRKTVMNGSPAADLVAKIENFDQELHQFMTALPTELNFNKRMLIIRACSSTRRTLIMLHIWWHQCFCDLYRILFLNLRESFSRDALQQVNAEFIISCRQRCLSHALELSQIFRTVNDLDSTTYVLTDWALAMCSYQCARILAHTRQAAQRPQELDDNAVLEAMKSCYDVIASLKDPYPSVVFIQNDIAQIIKSYYLNQNSGDSSDISDDVNDGPHQEASGSVSSSSALSQNRVMSKYGLIGAIVVDGERSQSNRIQVQELPDVEEATSARDAVMQEVQQFELPIHNQLLTPDIDNFSRIAANNGTLWIPDWNEPLDQTGPDIMFDPFFRNGQDWSWSNDFTEPDRS